MTPDFYSRVEAKRAVLRKATLCPYCSGSGVRLMERRWVSCDGCDGTGRPVWRVVAA